MRSSIEKRSEQVEQHPDVTDADLDYDDGEVVMVALCEKVDEDFERFVEGLDLDILSGPKYVGVGLEVVLG